MTDQQLSLDDLEIYIEAEPLAAIEQWLMASFPAGVMRNSSKKGFRFEGNYQQQATPITVVKNAGNTGFTSVWIKNRNAPWENDIDMARSAFAALSKPVRCNEAAWQQGDDPDRWLEISAKGEQIINWQTEE